MSFEVDEEILQDFLVEAGEILELLSEQLVDLENQPDDKELLNAIFRGFHTVKGGAGFLSLTPLVECCHIAENVFDILRNGQRQVSPELMDVVLQALDAVNLMFGEVREREEPTPADPELLRQLALMATPDTGTSEPAPSAAAPEPQVPAQPDTSATTNESGAGGDISDDEFEQLLDALHEAPKDTAPAPEPSASSSDEITDDEFEELLNKLHGDKKIGASAAPAATPAAGAAPGNSDEITDDEFEALLDQLHGGGAPSGVVERASAQAASSAQAPTPPAGGAAEGDNISDKEFEDLLDQLHGKGKGPAAAAATSQPVTPAPAQPKPAAAAKPSVAKPAAPVKAKEPPPATETTVRVDTSRLDDIMNMVGELVLVRNRLVRIGASNGDEALSKAVANLDVVTGDLQLSVMKTRMQPIKKVFGRFPRVVRDLARNLKKEINLQLEGEDTDLDKNLVEALADPLVHLVRNSVDHGIEAPEVREAAGKDRKGNVILAAEQEGDHILLSISDDGAGMDPNKLRALAVERGLFDQDAADRLSDAECFNLIFAPGFSTKKEISDVSGRGVGMDVVKTKISQLNGIIDIQSEAGKGTTILIKVPLTLAIMPTLMVMLGQQAFALPLVSVNEIFHLDLSKTNVVDGQEVVIVRDKALPLFYLKRWLVDNRMGGSVDVTEGEGEEAHVVIVSVGTQRVGFVVDQLVGQEEVVIKPLGSMLHGTPGMAGATITGDGRIALILDVPSMLKRYARRI
ncbi:chemotaxis protein CheA [Aestuariirhabdus litorea]|uniref:Chemotaxis protein CheA n=1 Tax=Aestuariirhabdus litorea TaxID=2528527 RepID=A0A3P3VSN0_9GAMM|nr:chemotaxis protein CheA [Aestuariirhabdus litorea]RRJ84978.1 chemotaxis protein CheA [Aestuariirhabdus litorea]RWW98202.1 chemotaxis protein CheA [Endozoicomonadaceae bacterium GTF-13]